MLIEFRVRNFRSIRDEQVLSMVASKDKSMLGANTLETGVKAAPVVLRSAAIYGANASGKSNLIKSLQYMRAVVMDSATLLKPGQPFKVQPFRLDKSSMNTPTEFEVTFLLGDVRYQYGFTMTQERIVSEYLLVYKSFKPQKWFERYIDDETNKEVYEFGLGLKGGKSTWEGATRNNALFLSTAVQLNSLQLRPVYEWFANQLVIYNEMSPLSQEKSVEMLKDPAVCEEVCNFLDAADTSIEKIDVETKKVPGHSFKLDFSSGKTEVVERDIEQNQLRFYHSTSYGRAVFELQDESSGTRNLLFLTGPVLEVLKTGKTLIIDEIDTSLHPLLVRELVRLFHKPEINIAGSQLVFTTHDTSLLDAPDLFRRDQIWFAEKDASQSTTLVGLSEFSPRKKEAIERGYLMGRYGGVPFLRDMMGRE